MATFVKDKRGRAVASFGGGRRDALDLENARKADAFANPPPGHVGRHRWLCGDGGRYTCAHCKLSAVAALSPTPEGCDPMEYAAFHIRGERPEWEPVPSSCPLPEHLRPYVGRRSVLTEQVHERGNLRATVRLMPAGDWKVYRAQVDSDELFGTMRFRELRKATEWAESWTRLVDARTDRIGLDGEPFGPEVTDASRYVRPTRGQTR